jgi:hypothetical protein
MSGYSPEVLAGASETDLAVCSCVAHGFLQKPFQMVELERALRGLLDAAPA